jgi:hypothetical protein
MGDRPESFKRLGSYSLGWRIWGDQLRMFVFQSLQLLEKGVIGSIGNLGIVEAIVTVVVVVDLLPEFCRSLAHRLWDLVTSIFHSLTQFKVICSTNPPTQH